MMQTTRYALEASHDYDPGPNLEKSKHSFWQSTLPMI
jgi:hypothetical protein